VLYSATNTGWVLKGNKLVISILIKIYEWSKLDEMNEKPICVYIPGWAFDGYNARHKRYTFTSFLSDTVVALPRLQPTTRMQYSVTMFSDWRHSTSDIRIVIRVIIAYDNSTTTYMTTFIVTYNNVLHSLFHIVSGWVGTGVRGTEVPPSGVEGRNPGEAWGQSFTYRSRTWSFSPKLHRGSAPRLPV